MTMDSTALRADRTGDGTSYPLDPLTGAEIEAAAAIIMDSEYSTPTLKFVMIQLAEPTKARELTFEGAEVPRRAFATMYDGAAKLIYEAVVDLGARVIDSWTSVPGRFPSYLVEHMTGVEEVVRADPRWQEAMRKRGVADFDLAMIDPWPAGYYGSQDHYENSALICRPLTFMRAAPSEHGYARPVEGLIVTFDLDAMTVIDIEDHGVVPLPPTAGNYAEKFMFDENNRPAFTGFRDGVKPIEITQPEGRASPSTVGRSGGRNGRCGSGSIRGRGSSCTRSPTTTAERPGQSCTGRHCRRWWCHTAMRNQPIGTRTSSTWVKSGWASRRIR
jgi:primary-amine oxidase